MTWFGEAHTEKSASFHPPLLTHRLVRRHPNLKASDPARQQAGASGDRDSLAVLWGAVPCTAMDRAQHAHLRYVHAQAASPGCWVAATTSESPATHRRSVLEARQRQGAARRGCGRAGLSARRVPPGRAAPTRVGPAGACQCGLRRAPDQPASREPRAPDDARTQQGKRSAIEDGVGAESRACSRVLKDGGGGVGWGGGAAPQARRWGRSSRLRANIPHERTPPPPLPFPRARFPASHALLRQPPFAWQKTCAHGEQRRGTRII